MTTTTPAGATPAGVGRDAGRSRVALATGLAYVALFVLGIGANVLVLEGLVVDDDPVATVAAIAARPGTFRLAMAAFLGIVVLDVVVAWGLHALLRRHGVVRSRTSAWARVAYSAVLGVAVWQLVRVDELVARAGVDADPTAVMAALDGFTGTWMVGLAVFGVHLVLLSPLLDRAGAPSAMSWLVGAAGVAYVADTLRHLLVPGAVGVESAVLGIVVVTSIGGEAWLTVWLLGGSRGTRDGAGDRAARAATTRDAESRAAARQGS